MSDLLSRLVNAAKVAAAAPHTTTLAVTPLGIEVRSRSSHRDPRAPDGATYAMEFIVGWQELEASRGDPLEAAIRLVNERIDRAFTPFKPTARPPRRLP